MPDHERHDVDRDTLLRLADEANERAERAIQKMLASSAEVRRLERQVGRAREALKDALTLFSKGYAIDHFNWAASALGAEQIRELNETPIKIAAALATLSDVREEEL